MALFHVSHPPWFRLVGWGHPIYIFSNISWTPWVLDPITNPSLRPSSWLHPASIWILLFWQINKFRLYINCFSPCGSCFVIPQYFNSWGKKDGIFIVLYIMGETTVKEYQFCPRLSHRFLILNGSLFEVVIWRGIKQFFPCSSSMGWIEVLYHYHGWSLF